MTETNGMIEFSIGVEVLSVRDTDDANLLKVLHGATITGKEAENRSRLSYISIQDDELIACNGFVMVWVKKSNFVQLLDYLPEEVNGLKLIGIRFLGMPKKGHNIIEPVYDIESIQKFPDNYYEIKKIPTLTSEEKEKVKEMTITNVAMNPTYIYKILSYLKGGRPMTFTVYSPVHPVHFKCQNVEGIIMPMHLGSW